MSQGISEVPGRGQETSLRSAAEGDLVEDLPPVGTDPTLDPEAPLADALEQRAPLGGGEDTDTRPGELRYDAEPADVAEQSRPVGLDDEDYR